MKEDYWQNISYQCYMKYEQLVDRIARANDPNYILFL